jgi:hypothetical protein
MGFKYSNDGSPYNPQSYLEHLAEHFEAGEITLRDALEAASLTSASRSTDITEKWQVALIALDEEELAHHFINVAMVLSRFGLGVTIQIKDDVLWTPGDITAEQQLAMNKATVACLRRHGVEAHLHEDGTMHIPQPTGSDDDVISKFIDELNDLPEEDPDKRGWGKWTT